MENAGAIRGDLILDDSKWKASVLGAIKDSQHLHVALTGLRNTTMGLSSPLAAAGREMDAFAARSLRAAWSVNRVIGSMVGRNMTAAVTGIAAQMPVAGRAMDALAIGGAGAAMRAQRAIPAVAGAGAVATGRGSGAATAGNIAMVAAAAGNGARATGLFRNAVGDLGRSFTSLAFPMAAAGGAMTAFFGKSNKAAMNVQESENLFRESMGNMEAGARAWSEQYAKSIGVNAAETRRFIGTMNVMMKSVGVAEKESTSMAQTLTALAYDMSSFYNIDFGEAYQKLQSGMVGEAEPLKRMGIIVNENAVKAYALKKGMIGVGQELSETGKIAARFGLIMQSTTTAQGDMVRTLGSATNQQRILGEQLRLLYIDIGGKLIPAMTGLYSRGVYVTKVMRQLIEFNPQVAAHFVKTAAGVTVAAAALGTLGFVGPYVLAPLVGVGKALTSVGMLGVTAAKGLAGIGLAATGITGAATATTGLGASLGLANVGATGIIAGMVGITGAAYVARAVVKGFERDFDALYVKAAAAEKAVGNETGGGFFGAVSRGWRRFDDWADKSGVAFTEFAGELLGGGGWKSAIDAMSAVMDGAAVEARKLKSEQDRLAKDFVVGSVRDQIQEDFGVNVDEMLGKLKNKLSGFMPDFDGMRKQIEAAMAAVNSQQPETPWNEKAEDVIGRLDGLAEAAKDNTKSMADDFLGAADSVDGLNDSLKETHGLLGSFAVGKKGTAGSGAPTPKAIMDAIGMKGAKGTAAPRPWLPQMGMGEGMAQTALGQAPPVADIAGVAGVPMTSGAANDPYASTYLAGYSGYGDWKTKGGITSDYMAKRGVSRNYGGKWGVEGLRFPVKYPALNILGLGPIGSDRGAGTMPIPPSVPVAKNTETASGSVLGDAKALFSTMVDLLKGVERNTREQTATVGGY